MDVSFVECLESRLHLTTTPNDPGFDLQWDLQVTGTQQAWDKTRGKPSVIVADDDTGVDYTHPDLYKNVWINQGEIPAAVKKKLTDTDGDKLITFWDLNNPANAGKVADVNRNGYIDGGDLLAKYKSDGTGGWADGKNGKGFKGDTYTDDIIGWDFANNDNNPMDYDGHGTHTFGTIAAVGDNRIGVAGVAWKASVIPVKIFDDNGNGASDSVIAKAIHYAVDAGSRVSNNSWGAAAGEEGDTLYRAIDYARAHNHVFVAAAGNDRVNNDTSSHASFPASYDLDNVLSVAASTYYGYLASFSNYGVNSVDLAAPGDSILSTAPGGKYQYLSGTSMAAPHVTGAIALMLAKRPTLTATQITNKIVATVNELSPFSRTTVSGGELNPAGAVGVNTNTTEAASAAPPKTKASSTSYFYFPTWPVWTLGHKNPVFA